MPGAQVVFLAHAADRTGAAITLLHQLRWLRANTDLELITVLLRDGPLLTDFEAIGPAIVIGEPDLNPSRTPAIEAEDARRRARLTGLAGADLVYVNTAWSINALPFLPIGPSTPVVAAIHELDHDLRDGMPPASLARLLTAPVHFIAGASVIATNLMEGYGVAPDRVTVVDEAIARPHPGPGPSRHSLGLDEEAFVVVAVGSPIWRKGPDLFVHLADRLARRVQPLRMRWLGADPLVPHPDLVTPLADVSRLGLEAVVDFHPPTDRVFDHLRCADAFVLTSREDANPLVCLEAAAVGLPVVCFDNGGIPVALGPAGCVEVPYPDIEAMADALVTLAGDDEGRRARGRAAAEAVRLRHDIETTGPVLLQTLERWLP